MKPVRMLVVLLGVAVVPFGVAACGDDDDKDRHGDHPGRR